MQPLKKQIIFTTFVLDFRNIATWLLLCFINYWLLVKYTIPRFPLVIC